MPIYSYKCNNCGKIFEKFEKIGSQNKIFCTDCNTEALRIFSPVGIVFKGKGFYSTDGTKSSKIASDNYSNKETNKEVKKEETAKKEEKSESKTSENKTPS
jgi:putative FmdB family regulatory protein